jgi:hypothetical protein
MNSFELLVTAFATAAGVMVATVTTASCIIRKACERRDRQLFRAYAQYPEEVEAWLVRGAMDTLQQSLTLQDAQR